MSGHPEHNFHSSVACDSLCPLGITDWFLTHWKKSCRLQWGQYFFPVSLPLLSRSHLALGTECLIILNKLPKERKKNTFSIILVHEEIWSRTQTFQFSQYVSCQFVSSERAQLCMCCSHIRKQPFHKITDFTTWLQHIKNTICRIYKYWLLTGAFIEQMGIFSTSVYQFGYFTGEEIFLKRWVAVCWC